MTHKYTTLEQRKLQGEIVKLKLKLNYHQRKYRETDTKIIAAVGKLRTLGVAYGDKQ